MKCRGFSLLELLVTLAIVALLAALAWPGYGAILHRAQRNDARLALLAIQHAQERHYQRFNAYSGSLTLPVASGGLGLMDRSGNGSYALAVSTSDDGQHFGATAQALPQGRQGSDHTCEIFLIDEIGRRAAMDAGGRDSTTTCWR